MTPAKFISKRMGDWKELEELLREFENRRDRTLDQSRIRRFARLYRAACTDLSLATAYRLPHDFQDYLGDLVSRSHSYLYSRQRRRPGEIRDFFFRRIPVETYRDRYVRIALLVFFVPFILSLFLAYQSGRFADLVVGETTLQKYYEMHSQVREGHSPSAAALAAGFYIYNNVGINLTSFATGILGGVGSLLVTLFNAVYLGVVIGYLLSTDAALNIITFTSAHAPFELTAVALSAGAGLRIGFSFIAPNGRRRLRALREESRDAVPVIAGAAMLTLLAAFLEAVIGPSTLPLPFRLGISGCCIVFMIVYFIVGGRLQKETASATGSDSLTGGTGF